MSPRLLLGCSHMEGAGIMLRGWLAWRCGFAYVICILRICNLSLVCFLHKSGLYNFEGGHLLSHLAGSTCLPKNGCLVLSVPKP